MDWPLIWTITTNVILVILGINALIIVHELGHFLVARMCGVRCDKFYIWFDFWGLKFFSFKLGQTEYGLGLFPLGGYVKMLGQEDNPGELRAEMERAKNQNADGNAEKSGDAKLNEGKSLAELQEAVFAPDSYLAKSVPQRMAIIVAGVTMNFLFAIVCGTAAYMVGVTETAPAVGNVIPGSAAWEAGIHVGDEIMQINGRPIRSFMDINMAMVNGASGVNLSIDRIVDGQNKTIDLKIVPRKRANDLAPMLGVSSLGTLNLVEPVKRTANWSPVRLWAKPFYSQEALLSLDLPKLRIASVDGTSVTDFAQFQDEQLKRFGESITCQLERQTDEKMANAENEKHHLPPGDVLIPAIPMKEIGIRFRPGPIVAVLPESDAQKQGIEVGDQIVAVDGDSNYDPMKLPEMILQKINAAANIEEIKLPITIKKVDGSEKMLEVALAPVRTIPSLSELSMRDPLGSTALGLAWQVSPVIAEIDWELIQKHAASQEVNIEVNHILGDESNCRVVSVQFIGAESLLNANSFTHINDDGFTLLGVGESVDMAYISTVIMQLVSPKQDTKKNGKNEKNQKNQEKIDSEQKAVSEMSADERPATSPITIVLEIEKKTDDMTKQYRLSFPLFNSQDWFRTDRGLLFQSKMTTVKVDNFGEALVLGTNKMIEYSLSVYKFLQRLADGSVSPRALGGPVMIVQAAYSFVQKGLGSYFIFLCLIGANLAVINLLPVPVLDGGHLVFLMYEGIFRRQPNETVQVVLSYLGLLLILSLMIWAISLDLGFIKRF
ncbi:MAG: site-2 protease family protein [Thermoguttaceae bacterium]